MVGLLPWKIVQQCCTTLHNSVALPVAQRGMGLRQGLGMGLRHGLEDGLGLRHGLGAWGREGWLGLRHGGEGWLGLSNGKKRYSVRLENKSQQKSKNLSFPCSARKREIF